MIFQKSHMSDHHIEGVRYLELCERGPLKMRKRVVTLYSGKEGDEPSLQKSPPGNGRPNKKLESSAQIEEVARGMFASMCSGLDGEVITEENIHEAVQNLADDSINPTQSLARTPEYALSSGDIKSSIKKLLQSILKGTNSREVTCELFCEAAVRHAEGKISIFDRLENMNMAATDAKMPEHANLETLMYHPVHTLLLMKQGVLKVVEKQGSKWVWSFFSTKHLYWFLAVYFVPMMTAQVIVSSVSTALFNATMLFLLSITVQSAIDLEKLQSRISYLSLFQYFNKAGTQIPMPAPKKSDMAPYVTFIGGLVVGVVFLGFSDHSFVYYELLGTISMVMAFLVVLQFDLYESPLFWVFVLAKAPSWIMVGLDITCALMPLPSPSLTSLRSPLWTLSLFEEFDFDVNIVTLLQCSVHLCLLVYAIKYSKFSYSSLGHHFLFFGWFVLCRNFISSSSPLHLVLISTSPLMFPFYSIGFLLSPLYFLYFYGLSPPFFYSVASIGVVVLLAVFVMATFRVKRVWWMSISIEYVVLLFMVFCFLSTMFLSSWYTSLYQVARPLPTVSVGEYGRYCGPGNWVDGNTVQTQINCMHLKNRLFRSDAANVKSVGISKVQDTLASSISFLPKFLERALACHLGGFEPMCGDRTDVSTCINTGCHFQHSLTYTFKIELEIPVEGVKTTLLVSHHHMDFVSKLRSGTSLQFDATFVDGMGSDHLTLQAVSLSAFGLEDTQNLERERNEDMKKSLMSVFIRSVKNSIIVLLDIFFGYAT